MYYTAGTGVRCSICAGQADASYSPGGSTFMRAIISWPPSWMCDVKSKIRLCQSIVTRCTGKHNLNQKHGA